MVALYLHIPFCLQKCRYCSFNSYPLPPKIHAPYQTALKKELQLLAKRTPLGGLDTLFIGGGTPTVLGPDLLPELVRFCLSLFGNNEVAEISIEANPGTVDLPFFRRLAEAGVNRVSLGGQSLDDGELASLGRIHSADEVRRAIEAALAAGIGSVNLDLMYGLAGQTASSWQRSLVQAVSYGVHHLSLYQLTVEEDTPLFHDVEAGRCQLPDEEEIIAMDAVTLAQLEPVGFLHYEISNYCRPGHGCRHNINYWKNEPYLAAGAGAVSFVDGKREKRVGDPRSYIAKISSGESVVVEEEQLDLESSFRETVIMALRMTDGVSPARLQTRFGIDLRKYYGTTLTRLVAQGLLQLSDNSLRLTPRGLAVANQVMAELV